MIYTTELSVEADFENTFSRKIQYFSTLFAFIYNWQTQSRNLSDQPVKLYNFTHYFAYSAALAIIFLSVSTPSPVCEENGTVS